MELSIITVRQDDQLLDSAKQASEILSKLASSIGGQVTLEDNRSLVTLPIYSMEKDQPSVISSAEYINGHKIRVPLIYHKMITECWAQHYIGPLVQSCGLVIFSDPKMQKFTSTQSCYFITSIESLHTRTLLFTYDNGKINHIASFKWDHNHKSLFIAIDGYPQDIISMFVHQVHEQMFRIGWAAITAVPQAAPRDYKPSENTTVKEWFLRD